MPNNTALGAGAGFFQGFNSIFGPHMMRAAEQQQQQQSRIQAAVRKEVYDVLTPLQDHGLLDQVPGHEEVIQWAYDPTGTAKQPKQLAEFIAYGKSLLTGMEDKVPTAVEALQGGGQPAPQQPAAPAAPAQPTAPAPAGGMDMNAAAQSLTQAGMDPALLGGQPAAQPVAAPAPEQPATPEPIVFGTSPEDQAALRIAKKQQAGISTTIRHKYGSVTFPGQTFTEQQKRGAGNALRDAMNDVPLDQALAKVDDPALRKGVTTAFGAEMMKRMAKAGLSQADSVHSIAGLWGSDAVPKRDWEQVMGPALSAAKADAVTPTILAREAAKTPILVDRAQKTAEATAPIKVDTAGQIAENNKKLNSEYSLEEKNLVAKALGIDTTQPLSDQDAADLLDALGKKKARADHQKLGDTLQTKENFKADQRIPYKEMQSLFDPDTGRPAAIILRNSGVKTIMRKDTEAMGAVSLDKDGIDILRSAQKTNKILDQYLEAALKVFTSESPAANFTSSWKKFLTANKDYQDLLSEDGKLATMIRALGEKGALAEKDVERGQEALLMGRGAVSRSQIIESVNEINEIIQTGISSLGFNAAKIVPRPSALSGATAPTDNNWVQ